LAADFVDVVKDRSEMSAKYRLPFLAETDPLCMRCLCDSSAICTK